MPYLSIILIINISLGRDKAAIVVEYAYHLSNKDITTSNRIYGIICPRINIRILAGKPTRHRRVAVDFKVSRYIEERDTIINLIIGNLTITTKG